MAKPSLIFNPPYEVPVQDGVVLQVYDAFLDPKRGMLATVDTYNGKLLNSEKILLTSSPARSRYARAVQAEEPSVEETSVSHALVMASVGIRGEFSSAGDSDATDETLPVHDADALWALARPLAEDPNLLDRIVKMIADMGTAGEEKNLKLLYLAATARLLKQPVSIFIKGPSGIGKSHLIKVVLALFPESAYVNYTTISPHYLSYSSDDLRHRIVCIYEASGLEEGFGAYLMRSLLSEGRIQSGTVGKNEEGAMGAIQIDKEGPTALFTSTCMVSLDAELETRALSLAPSDDAEQSAAIVKKVAASYMEEALDLSEFDLSSFHALQEWLSLAGEKRVCIPFAERLAQATRCVNIRIRRDFPKLMSLIAACALLHQAQREHTEDGRIIASTQDYRMVYDLFLDAFMEAQSGGLNDGVRRAIGAVVDIQRIQGNGASVTAVAAYLEIDKSSASRNLSAACEKGYLCNPNAGRKGSPSSYRPVEGIVLPDQDTPILPKPDDLDAEQDGVTSLFL